MDTRFRINIMGKWPVSMLGFLRRRVMLKDQPGILHPVSRDSVAVRRGCPDAAAEFTCRTMCFWISVCTVAASCVYQSAEKPMFAADR